MMNDAKRSLITFVSLALISACANLGQPSPETQITSALQTFHAAELQGDIDTIMATYSEDFADPMGVNKAQVKGFFQAIVPQGALKDLQVDMSAVTIDVDGNDAVINGVKYSSALGKSSYEYIMRKESDDTWRFTSARQL